ncbi:MAG: DUF134 domain-containing protein [Tenuifilum sp.]|uniref:DUF134 domain-containing protein n=1 Tax=Tenuifilum sp. TaxID=2760880 RepID=UPI001B6DE9C8|nr:DUF134 domain-containing protein [Bacteroidales bacterium]HOK61148.1 DUF134 domain-containing protein [Tenuifilum sp.]HOK85788.1 DUF134 domain-containing protein [Tenuifilum sp.]HON71018.1 DUF134 domain-containing protein [Tenuifilum sp.]HOU74317.1 DUF134 domain-containing protein [Tenuifilum sp.]
MPRSKCPRRICHSPDIHLFKPAGKPLHLMEIVVLEADELEAIRLADGIGLYHEEAAKQMGVSRQTFGRILEQARSKVAKALTNGMALRINKSQTEIFCDQQNNQNSEHI